MTAVLDAWAAVAFLQDETAAARVEKAIAEGSAMSDVNVGEALYVLTRRQGPEPALDAMKKFRGTIKSVAPDWSLTRDAAMLKARGGLSYADAFAVATAQRLAAPLFTGDPEIIAFHGELVDVVDLREESE